ncbi:P-loop containing nucleoside triphosphate hydrolase protein [Dactylonectria macrodidyma]|uniref:P-loop containing nucleoside triphosphate hydrolase protein n=1 Tax=Dactylonectria macrodidyma TaxID=307937 RepID=A0A9P9FTK3_9HYPO|nr:P-loop containing nucleoside triphosphate hydrolase protein [Dactylonectria macrodidyma]
MWANSKVASGFENCDDAQDTMMLDAGGTEGTSETVNGRIAWVTPSNKLAEDARARLAKRSSNKTIIHVFPWDREVANLLDADAKPPPDADAAALSLFPRQYAALASHLANYRKNRWSEFSPAAKANSLSEFAKSLIAKSPDAFPDQVRAMAEYADDRHTFNKNRAENMVIIRTLLEFALSRADAIVATPVAMLQLSQHMPTWNPDLYVIDEVGRMSEASAFIPVSAFPEVPCFILGDPKQCTPVSRTADATSFDDVFGKQRRMSLLDRLDSVDVFNITLNTNWRSHGTVAEFAQVSIYHGRMSIGHKGSSAVSDMSKYMRTLGKKTAEGTSMFIDVQGGAEDVIGTSFVNPTNALIVRELAVQLFRDAPLRNMTEYVHHQPSQTVHRGTIMILTGYANQKLQYEAILNDISPAEIPEGHLTVRTIDDSVSAEADIVIVDLVRTSRPGFLTDLKRVAVMTTRARLAHFFVGSADTFQHAENIGGLIRYLKSKGSIFQIKGERKNWSLWCMRCHQPGHVIGTCRESPRCNSCFQKGIASDHAIRNCSDPAKPNNFYGEPIGMLDNVHRSISDFDKKSDSGGKRVTLQKRKKLDMRQVQKKLTPAERRYREENSKRSANYECVDEDMEGTEGMAGMAGMEGSEEW